MKTQTTKQIFALLFVVLLISLTSALTIKSVSSTPQDIAPGENADIKITIENNLGEDLENVMVSLDLSQAPFAPYQSSTDKIINEIDDDDEESVNFKVIAMSDADAGIYKIPVVISYFFNDTIIPKTSFISLTINAEPELEISYAGDLIRGQNNKINIKITNTGLTGIKFLEVELKDSTNTKVLGSKKVYIGDIESDDFDSIDFNLFIDNTASSSTTLPIKLSYRDATNNIKTESINLQIKTYNLKEAQALGLIKKNNTMIYLGLAVVLVVLWVVYRKLKKRKKKKD